jgi:hypothetical protein
VRWYEFSNFRIHPSIVNFPSWYCRVTTYCLASPPAAATFHHSPSCSGLACAWLVRGSKSFKFADSSKLPVQLAYVIFLDSKVSHYNTQPQIPGPEWSFASLWRRPVYIRWLCQITRRRTWSGCGGRFRLDSLYHLLFVFGCTKTQGTLTCFADTFLPTAASMVGDPPSSLKTWGHPTMPCRSRP